MNDSAVMDAIQDTARTPVPPQSLNDAATSADSPAGVNLTAAGHALQGAVERLLVEQDEAGCWCAELEGDSILQSEYLLMKWMLGQERDSEASSDEPRPSGSESPPSPNVHQTLPHGRGSSHPADGDAPFDPRLPRIADYLRKQQQDDGAWVQFPGAAMDLSATVKGYFALKLMGDDPQAEHMRKARQRILEAGGAEKCNSFSKFYLAGLGQVSYDALPSIPPELVFLPKAFYFHMDKISAWSRTMIAPLSIVTACRPVRELPPELGIGELFVNKRNRRRVITTQDRPHPLWSRFFLGIDRGLKLLDRIGHTPPRKVALERLEQWMLQRLNKSDGLGAIFPPMVYIQVALRALGYPDDHPVLVKARRDLDELMIFDDDRAEIRIQPCFSPVWDTGIAAYALTEAGLDSGDAPMRRCGDWLLGKEVREHVDWASNVEGKVEPSGWFFEYNNFFYPDVDDTAMVSMSLKRIGGEQAEAAARRGVAWAFAMQNDEGGWAAFDRTEERPILEHVPFADHNAIQDPACPDITGRVLESLGNHGYTVADRRVRQAVDFIHARQEYDGAWFGRWGVNYVYGTFQVLVGLELVGCDMSQPWVRRAGQWFKDHQHDNGAFGESANSYEDSSLRGQGPATASQTAWGAMGLMAVYGPDDPAVHRAIHWLIDTQCDDGNWAESWFTGTGFPRVFYLRYHLYRLYFPLMALARYLRRHDALPTL